MEKSVCYLPYNTIKRKYTGIAEGECQGNRRLPVRVSTSDTQHDSNDPFLGTEYIYGIGRVSPKPDAITHKRMEIGIVNHQQCFQLDIGLYSSNHITSTTEFWNKLIDVFLPRKRISNVNTQEFSVTRVGYMIILICNIYTII
jgi:hypothetical protein